MISLIAAVNHSPGYPIGATNEKGEAVLPWPHPSYVSADLKRFKMLTEGKMIVMGRKTWNSLGVRKPLPNRTNVIISSGEIDYGKPKVNTPVLGFNSVHSFVNSSLAWNASKEGEIMVIGGSTLYQQFFKRCDRIYLTTFYFKEDELITPDTFFPREIVEQVFEGKSPDWRLVDKSFALKEPNESGISEVGALFATYEKINAPLRI